MISFSLAREELARLISRPILRLALIVLMVVPLLYGALYLWAFWDPYGNLDRIPVALVNLDRPARAGDETITAGTDLTDELLDERTFQWHTVSAAVAERGVKDGTYYSSITIPADFSATLATADSDAPRKAELAVMVHESKSMIAAQIENKVFGEVRKAAAASASEGYYDNIFLGFSEVRDGMTEASDGAEELADGLADADEGSGELAAGASDAREGGSALASGLGKLSAGANTLSGGIKTLKQGSAKLAEGADELVGGVDALAGGAGSVARGADDLAGGMGTLSQGAATLAASADQVSAGVAQVSAGVGVARTRIGEAAAGAAQVRDGAAGVRSLLAAFAAAHPELADDATLRQAMGTADAVAGGASTLASGLDSAKGDAATLSEGAQRAAAGASQLAEGASRLAGGVSSATDGARTLAAGAGEVSGGSARLEAGARALDAGAGKLAGGAGDAATGGTVLAAGLRDAHTGAQQLAAGLARLDDGTAELADGLGDAASGSRELADGLTAGVEDVPAYTAAQRADHAEMMSDPVGLTTKTIGEVTNYGTGFAPYFIPLALWVGSLIVFLVVNPLPEKAVRSGAPAPIVALAGLWPGILLATGQSVLMYVVLRAGLGLAPVKPLAFFGTVLLIAVVYSAILQWLSVSFGPSGKLLGIIALMLQLTSAAGTFPLETLPGFFRTISPWLPMTYAVAALREAISGGDLSVLLHNTSMLAVFGVAAFLGMSVTAWRARGWDSDRLKPSFEL